MLTKPAFHSLQVSDARYYYLELNPPKTDGWLVVCGGREQCDPDYRIVRPQGFMWHTIEFVATGSGELTIRRKRYPLQPGSVFYYGPGIPHVIQNDPRQPMLKYFVDFAGDGAKPRLARSALRGGAAVQSSAPSELLLIFDQLQRDGARGAPQSAAACLALLEYLLVKIEETAVDPAHGGPQALGAYRRCRDYLDANFHAIRSIEDAAAHCQVGAAYLCRLFKRFDSQSPYQTLTRLKMNRAAGLLLTTTLSVQEVARSLAYDDPYHFSRVFKTTYGVAPAHFRQSGGKGGRGVKAGDESRR